MAQPRKVFTLNGTEILGAADFLNQDESKMNRALLNRILCYAGLPVLDIVRSYRHRKEKRRQFLLLGDTNRALSTAVHTVRKWRMSATLCATAGRGRNGRRERLEDGPESAIRGG